MINKKMGTYHPDSRIKTKKKKIKTKIKIPMCLYLLHYLSAKCPDKFALEGVYTELYKYPKVLKICIKVTEHVKKATR